MLINMRLEKGKRSQFIWHVGEPWPVPAADDENVTEIYADGDELSVLKATAPAAATAEGRTLTIGGADACYTSEWLRHVCDSREETV